MTNPSFSERNGLVPKAAPQADDYLPEWVREALTNAIQEFVTTARENGTVIDVYRIIRPYVWKVLDRQPATNPMNGPWAMYIPRTIAKCEWWRAYDIVEEIARVARLDGGEELVAMLAARVNPALSNEGIAWALDTKGMIERVIPGPISNAVKEARHLLEETRFEGPDNQFAKAIEFINRRPDPDEENSVKEAVGALEGVANIVSGKTNLQLNTVLHQEPLKSQIAPTVRAAIEKLYAYRGAAAGVAHSQVGPTTVDIAEALWALGVVATSIIYIAKKFPE